MVEEQGFFEIYLVLLEMVLIFFFFDVCGVNNWDLFIFGDKLVVFIYEFDFCQFWIVIGDVEIIIENCFYSFGFFICFGVGF